MITAAENEAMGYELVHAAILLPMTITEANEESRWRQFLAWREEKKNKDETSDQLSTNFLRQHNKIKMSSRLSSMNPLAITMKDDKTRNSIDVISLREREQSDFSSATFPPQHQQSIATKQIKRKPLPKGCPHFEFDSIQEKTLISEQEEKDQPQPQQQQSRRSVIVVHPSSTEAFLLAEKTEIPARRDSRFYMDIPSIRAHLDHACKNEKIMLIRRHYEQQRQKHLL
ncbi:hypothetical protein BDF20DRAFT_984031 [Mycotypha africana]|uniref:uncharacterized protein n=1 Tax=Mycotypha africana TaxID=64632 RepID=UPI0022FFEB83|nr:uncharacterized protein BDF20DRAFT_984031 [Mycotypha africana]KAI8991358.1 hypothetical protein BDF20DRAFT_984031 [Mycotypha africana]